MITETKNQYLCYLIVPCETGSEGWSGWMYYCVAEGDTPEQIVRNWIENVNLIYGIDLSKDLYIDNKTGHISVHYYPFYMNELKTSVYGHSEKISIDFNYIKH